MKNLFLFGLVAVILSSCANGQTQNATKLLPATEFADQIKAQPNAAIVDVRSPEEFGEGHLQNAVNFNINGDRFDQQIATLDKSAPVFVYCRSGGRSAQAVAKMHAKGFENIIELDGGILKWQEAKLKVTTEDMPTSNEKRN